MTVGHPGDFDRPSSRRQVTRILSVLGSAVLLGCLLVIGMIYWWGAGGTYTVADVLLAPEMLEKLAYSSQGKAARDIDKLVFDSITYRSFDRSTSQWLNVPVTPSTYHRFYDLVARDRSVQAITTASRFDTTHPTILTIWVRTQNARTAERRAFQEIEISSPGDLYRVEMHDSSATPWAYFEHPGIGQIAYRLFMQGL